VEVVALRNTEPSVVVARLVLDGASLAAFGTADSKADSLAIAFDRLQFTYYEQAADATAIWPSAQVGDPNAEGE
jgi:hypothetical protein